MASSPAWNYLTRLWTVGEFKIETDNGWGRSQLRRIDTQLAKAKAAEGDPTRYVAELARLVDECREWMISKEKKFARKAKTWSYEKRLKAITILMAQALQHLKFFAFEGRKQRGADPDAVGLKPGFNRERAEFEDMKANNPWNHGMRLDPHSASFVTAGMGDIVSGRADMVNRWWDRGIDPIIGKSVDMMSDNEFLLMSQQLKRNWGVELSNGGFLPRVHYIRKQERINNNMLIPLTGLLYKDSGRIPYTSAGHEGKDIYAMDKYGNLMSVASDATFSDGTLDFKSEHRHSSLNAGNKVICAGYIKIEAGLVKYIDNKSGHYKPTREDLAMAVYTLMEEDNLDLGATNIVGYVSIGPNSIRKDTDVIGGTAFINKVVPPPPPAPAY